MSIACPPQGGVHCVTYQSGGSSLNHVRHWSPSGGSLLSHVPSLVNARGGVHSTVTCPPVHSAVSVTCQRQGGSSLNHVRHLSTSGGGGVTEPCPSVVDLWGEFTRPCPSLINVRGEFTEPCPSLVNVRKEFTQPCPSLVNVWEEFCSLSHVRH